MKNITLTSLFLFVAITSFSQTATSYLSPVSSPQASVSQNVGMTNISINYSSPGVKGRQVFGLLVPYNQVWRAGANSPTIIKFSTSVIVGEKTLSPNRDLHSGFIYVSIESKGLYKILPKK